MEKLDVNQLEKKAKEIRSDVIRMISEAGAGHPGGALSAADIITALFFNVMNHSPKFPNDPKRDRFVLSKGHSCAALYAALARCGYFPVSELLDFGKIGSRLQGHPSKKDLPFLEASTGSLGQGISVAVGIALGLRLSNIRSRVYCMIGDGELDEGEVWEALMSASHFQLDNLCVIVDRNGLQIDGWTEDVMDSEPLFDKFEAFGFHVLEIDGNNMHEILDAFEQIKHIEGKPALILANTIKGKGVSFMENKAEWHGKAPTKEQAIIALKELGLIKDD